ncbi:MAG: ubiquinone biosynthesis accessory factor UbiK [Methylomagnum sp.]
MTHTAMLDTTTLNDLAKRLAEAIPADVRLFKSDMEKNFHAILQASFSKMNLVSREEFDVQRAVLARTREQLAALEARIAELEKQTLAP